MGSPGKILVFSRVATFCLHFIIDQIWGLKIQNTYKRYTAVGQSYEYREFGMFSLDDVFVPTY